MIAIIENNKSKERYSWWASLKHGGLLIAPSKLEEFFPEDIASLKGYIADHLRRDVVRVLDGDDKHLSALLDTVLEEVLGLSKENWSKGSAVEARWSHKAITQENIKPRRIWQGPYDSVLAVFVGDASLGMGRHEGSVPRIGVGRGRRAVSRVVEWLRRANQKIALLTNGRQWRLIHAGADYDAWCEWDIDLWFQEGMPGPQVAALRLLLNPEALQPAGPDKPSPIIAAIQASRKGQAELSSVLGERVRQAVEHLIRISSESIEPLDSPGPNRVDRRDIYIAATRIVMRCVVILFAEARDLLPRDNVIYNDSYSIQGLRTQLEHFAGGRAAERLRYSHSAWPRLISLFRLVYYGSAHESLPIPRYGGGLFTPGDLESKDPILRSLAAFETPANSPSDAAVHIILELLCSSKMKVRQGKGTKLVAAPVDFSDLSSEYIGILYEGLLDFELRRAPADDAMIFLNIGDQPALPFDRLDGMTEKDIAKLLEKLKKSTKDADSDEEEDEEGEEATEELETDDLDTEVETEPEQPFEFESSASGDGIKDPTRAQREIVQTWAERAVRAARLVRNLNDQQEVAKAAGALYQRIVMPNEWFLVRWGGTRKGSGTFYTRPQLAVPTTRRTLQPLAYEAVSQTTDEKTGLVTVIEWRPKPPEEILALKVCDPAMGSGSFLIAALRYLVEALVESLHFYGRLDSNSERTICKLADGLPVDDPSQEILPVPKDHPEFEERLRARLKRFIVEQCIYGVDLDPLAVELARMALWVETMDRELPFSFLDHKLKCGNSLIGCWFDQFHDYPVMAWERKGGDENHTKGVHYQKEAWSKAISEFKNAVIKPELIAWITAQREDVFDFRREGYTAEGIHDEALVVFQKLHELPVKDSEERATLYKEKILNNPAFQQLKEVFDNWCAVWFWSADQLNTALTPKHFYDPLSETRVLVEGLVRKYRFFHWEIEFPDVFAKQNAGFDAIIGNPPWEIQKPNSREFFSNIDPLYRTYGKQEALNYNSEYFNNEKIERDWLSYCAEFKALSNWNKNVAWPFGDKIVIDGNGKQKHTFNLGSGGKNSFSVSQSYHDVWVQKRSNRKGYTDSQHPFRNQGSADINTYKMFLEVAYTLLREGGQLGLLVPSGIYTDDGSRMLRNLFLNQCRWAHLYAFQNERFVFRGIHHSYKIASLNVCRSGKTSSVLTRFRLGPGNSPESQELEEDILDSDRYLPMPLHQIQQFSPKSKGFLEICSDRDLQIMEKIYANSNLLGDDSPNGWGIEYAREFDMTNDSKLFPPRPKWEEQGYCPDEYGHWLKGKWKIYDGPRSILKRQTNLVLSSRGNYAINIDEIEDVALPLYQGVMINQFDFSQKGWISGTGARAKWNKIDWNEKSFQPQYLLSPNSVGWRSPSVLRLGFRDIARTTDARTLIAAALPPFPAGNKVPLLFTKDLSIQANLLLLPILNSFCFDYLQRSRQGSASINYYILSEQALPIFPEEIKFQVIQLVASIAAAHLTFSSLWSLLLTRQKRSWKQIWAITSYERLRIRCMLDAIIADQYGLDISNFKWILRDCDYPPNLFSYIGFTKTLEPKGFWRVEKEMDPELRHTVLSLIAFHELKRVGLDAFLELNDGEGWMLPETLRLADYGLGHDDRAKEHQPVASRLGPRFLPWQLEQSPEESWEECERHAELIAKIVPPPAEPAKVSTEEVEQSVDLFGNPLQTNLFGEVIYPSSKKKKR
jgi:hypothetical protein